jgi:DNA-binding response OmpR family regulator
VISRIFVVDDEPVITATLTTILKINGYDARGFNKPLEALEAARTSKPDLLISDVIMPLLSGIDLAISIKEQHPTCKVLLLAAYAGNADYRGFPIMVKPFHPADLLAWLEDADV